VPSIHHLASAPSEKAESAEIRAARSVAEVEALRPAWAGWPAHRDSDIDFYLMIVRSRPEVLRPHVIGLFRNGQPTAILVGRLEQKRLKIRVGYLSVLSPWVKCLTFVCGALHGDASTDHARRLLREVASCLRQGEADLAVLEFVPLDSVLYQLALALPGVAHAGPAPQGHSFMTVPDSIDEVYGRMSGQRRWHIRASAKKLRAGAAGVPKVVCYRNPRDLDRLFEDAEQIARKTYQRELGVGFSETPEVRARLSLAAEKGWLRAYVLYLEDRPCAFLIGMIYGDTFLGEYTGYDHEFRHLSPGMVLIMHAIETFCEHADGDFVRQVDFGPGNAEYKEVLGDRTRPEATIYVFGSSLRGLALKYAWVAAGLVDRSARRLLTAAGLFAKVKSRWRKHLARRSQAKAHGVKG
jgi:hypothetical protein